MDTPALQAVAAADHPTAHVVHTPADERHLKSPIPTESTERLLPWLVAVEFFTAFFDTTILNRPCRP